MPVSIMMPLNVKRSTMALQSPGCRVAMHRGGAPRARRDGFSRIEYSVTVPPCASCIAGGRARRAPRGTPPAPRPDRLARVFGGETGDRRDKFSDIAWHRRPGESLILDEAPAWFVGRVEGRVDGADHVAFLLAPEAAENLSGGEAVLLSLHDARDITPGHPVA
ncbi:flavin reductase [Streptomyces sp. NPDC056210]|uniref:flavin reductase n=1 Tax=Streptomyces sp. NPDC056210 TaxID=3345746 RepID=UPI0035DBCA82